MLRSFRGFDRSRIWEALCVCILFGAVTALFLTSPKQNDFWWTDAPGHALNGAVLHDYLINHTFNSPIRFATDYYFHYPALTLTLYPPALYLVEAMVYFGTGVSNFGAQLSVAVFTLILAYFAYKTARTAFSAPGATGVALLVLSMPAVALWSRQVMVDVPALALLAGAAAFFLRFLDDGKPRQLYASVLLVCAAAYTKQTAIFSAAPLALCLIAEKGLSVLRERSTWIAAALGFFLLLPLAGFIVVFDPYHLEVVSGIGPEAGSTFTIHSWLWYARALPGIVGWAPIIAAIGYLSVLAWTRRSNRQERRLAVLMLAWFIADYLFISPIAHREDRYGIFLTLPIGVLAIALVMRILPRRFATGAAFAVGALSFVIAIATLPVPKVQGYDAVAAFILKHAGENGVILFHGYRSPNFVFSLRSQSTYPRVYVLRSEKLLLNYRISRDWGIKDDGVSRETLEDIVNRYGVTYVVFQPDFWTDLPSMAAFQNFIYSDRFTKLAEFPIEGNISIPDREIAVFKNNQPTHPDHPEILLNMPLLGGKISGKF